jgi:hypothetical protein
MNLSSINHGLMNNVYNFSIRGSRLKCSGYRFQKQSNVDNLNNVDIPGTKRRNI